MLSVFALVAIGYTVWVVFAVRRAIPPSQRLPTPATLLLVVLVHAALWSTNWVANRVADGLFVLGAYGIEIAAREHLRITWASRTQVIISNGDHFGRAASQILQFITFAFWIGLLIAAFFLVQGALSRLTPRLWTGYANWWRTCFHPPLRK